jgi:nucleoside phosphorylase
MESRIALVVALAQERRALERCLVGARHRREGALRLILGEASGHAVLLIQAGVGRGRARMAIQAVSRQYPLRGVWSLGFAGGLAEGLLPGDLVCPGAVLADDGSAGRSLDAPQAHGAVCASFDMARLPHSTGPLLTVDSPLRTPQAKQAARHRTGAVAVDMEAAAVADAAGRLGVPWLAIKGIVDSVQDPLPEFLAGCLTEQGDMRWLKLIAALLPGGGRGRVLRRLGQAADRAALGLRRGLEVGLQAWRPP